MSLYQKHRPQKLADFHGNRTLVESLETLLAEPAKMPHAILLTGPSGCGKTTLARIIARAIGCSDMDFKEMNTADFRGIDTVRDILRQMSLRAMDGFVRVWLIDECHQLSKDAQNAILKGLEDAPRHTYFMLATTDPQKLLKTIITRCMEFKVAPLGERQMTKLLNGILAIEGKGDDVAEDVLALISKESLGSPRAAINALQKVMNLDPKQQGRAVEKALADENEVIELCRALIAGRNWGGMKAILKGLQEQDPEGVRRAVLGYCNIVLLGGDSARAAAIIKEFQYPTYDSGWPSLTASCYMIAEMSK